MYNVCNTMYVQYVCDTMYVQYVCDTMYVQCIGTCISLSPCAM